MSLAWRLAPGSYIEFPEVFPSRMEELIRIPFTSLMFVFFPTFYISYFNILNSSFSEFHADPNSALLQDEISLIVSTYTENHEHFRILYSRVYKFLCPINSFSLFERCSPRPLQKMWR